MFSGGEPLLSFKVLKEFSSYFKDKFRYVLITNGSFINQQVAEWISSMGVEVHVNIPTFNHEKYPTIVRSGVSLQSVLDNLKLTSWSHRLLKKRSLCMQAERKSRIL